MVKLTGQMERILIIAMLMIIMGEGTVFAYTLSGWKWPNHKATYKITSNFGNQGPGWKQRALDAITNWNAVKSSAFSFESKSSSNNIIDASSQSCGNTCLAETTPSYNGSTMTKFVLKINVYQGFAFYDGSQAPTVPSNYYDLRSTMRHELGHALGLDHSGTGDACLMSTQTRPGVERPLDKDAKDGLLYLYDSKYKGPGPGGCIK